MIIRFSASVLLLWTTSLFAQENLISCGTSAGFQFRCAIPAKTSLLPSQPIESEYRISYQMTCNRNYPGPVPSKVRVSLTDGPTLVVNFNDKQENVLVGTGTGEMFVSDIAPKEMAALKYQECSLKFWNPTAAPSARIVAEWNAQKTSLESQLALATAARDANKSLAVLESSLKIYSNFMTSILATEASENELVAAIKDLKSCSNASDDPVDCERTIDKLAGATSLFTEDESSKITRLQTILDRINFDAVQCPESGDCTKTLLKKYLSTEDLALLEEAKVKLKEADGASQRADTYGNQVEDLNSQLIALKEKSKGSIKW